MAPLWLEPWAQSTSRRQFAGALAVLCAFIFVLPGAVNAELGLAYQVVLDPGYAIMATLLNGFLAGKSLGAKHGRIGRDCHNIEN